MDHRSNPMQGESHTTAGLLVQLNRKAKDAQDILPQDAMNTRMAACVSGFLERVPGSWQHQFIKTLPPASRSAVFASSRCLAQRVMEASAGVTLMLCGREELTAEQAEVRRNIITGLLRSRQQRFAVKLRPATWQPFPTELADRATSLTSEQGCDVVASCCQWGTLSHLYKLCLTNEADINGLCEAAEAGHLQQLRGLTVPEHVHGPILDRLVRTLGPQLEEVTTCCKVLQTRVHGLTALRSLTLSRCILATDVGVLWEHPTLRHVTLQTCRVLGDHRQHKCNWERLTLQPAHIEDLQRMPLAGVQQVYISPCIIDDPSSDASADDGWLVQIADKFVLQPDTTCKSGLFAFANPSACMAVLAKRMQGVKAVCLMDKINSPDAVTLLWKALPASVELVTLREVMGIACGHFWQGLPQHVVGVSMVGCDVSVDDVRALACTAPPHLQIFSVKAANATQFAEWQAADLLAAAPKCLCLLPE